MIARLKARLRCWLRGTHVMAIGVHHALGVYLPTEYALGYCQECGKKL